MTRGFIIGVGVLALTAVVTGIVLTNYLGDTLEHSCKQAYDTGYKQALQDAGTGYTVRNPSYQEVVDFIASDLTDKNEYDNETYTCVNFAADFKNNAFNMGYRCGFVEIEFPQLAHAITCFNTTDNGLIFVEPQYDEIINLTIGNTFWDRDKYEPPTYNDTVVRFTIIW